MRRSLALVALLASVCVACTGGGSSSDGSSSSEGTAAAGGPTASTATRVPPSEATISIADAAERELVQSALAGLPSGIEVSDQPITGGTAYIVEAWAAVTDQRRDVLELSLDELRGALRGEVTDWSVLGGAPLPITVEAPASGGDAIARQLAPDGLAAGVVRKPLDEVLADAESQPGMLALVPLEELRPGVLALVIDGYDPYRDPVVESPLRVERWVKAPDADTAQEVALRLGWTARRADFNPASVLATGDFIPARCAWSYAEADGGASAVFDAPGVRDLLRAADLTIVSLDAALSATNPPTPCVETVVLQGPVAAVDALEGAGVDVVTRAANHAFDCWLGCPGAQVMVETDAALEDAGIGSTGSGYDLAQARAPLVIERDGVRFAILSYDDIAPWYHATPGGAGTAGLDLATLGDDVRAAKAQADHVLVAVHAGVEYQTVPTERQREAARIAAEAGASLVIGNHPHWAQATEQIGDAFVVYALGNFVFDQPWSVETQQGMVLEAGFTRERMLGYRLRPEVIRDRYQPNLVDLAGEGAPLLQRVWEASDQIGR